MGCCCSNPRERVTEDLFGDGIGVAKVELSNIFSNELEEVEHPLIQQPSIVLDDSSSASDVDQEMIAKLMKEVE